MEWNLTIVGVFIGAGLSLPVLLLFNHIKNKQDRCTMRENMAELLHNELLSNVEDIALHYEQGIHARPLIFDNVYNGLLSSGNMRYLMDRQHQLYRLYVRMRSNELNLENDIREEMSTLAKIFTPRSNK